ncbi:hypothetical protein [Dokdonella soli]|uniref:Right handed beta helix domain-containing protein n=1 Tax=Dokdonella soli TaxID=529810 RepID=A0ABN1IQI7_9GAMM
MSGNVVEDANNQPTDGAVILVGSRSHFVANRLILRGNAAAYAINVLGDDDVSNDTELANCLIVDNHTRHELVGVRRSGPTILSMDGCTLAHNTIDNGYVLYRNGISGLFLTDSIIDMPGVQTVDGGASAHYVLSNDTSTLRATANLVVQGEPSFVNVAVGDYHLLPSSLGVDFAPAAGGTDLDRLPRDVDLPQVPNFYGPRDIGAYERQSAFLCDNNRDAIFCDGFEAM